MKPVLSPLEIESYVEATELHPRVADAISALHTQVGVAYCEGCGSGDKAMAGQCKGCHTARYCSIACQRLDWNEGGHSDECAAIQSNQAWTEASTAVVVRHMLRCAARLECCAKNDTAPIGKYWMQGAVKHPGSFRRAAARADKGRFKGRTSAFAHHVLANKDHKHNSGLLHKRAALALTFAKARRHRHHGAK